MPKRAQKRPRSPSSPSSERNSCHSGNSDDESYAEEVSDTDDEMFAEEVSDTDEEDTSSVDFDEHSEQGDPGELDNVPLSERLKELSTFLSFKENAPFIPVIHPFTDLRSGVQQDSGLDHNSSCIEIFKAFVSEEFVDMIACQSNLYKEKKITDLKNSKKLKKNSRLKKCYNITMDEIYTLQAIFIIMGIVKKPTIELYWTEDHMIETPFFGDCMTLVRFQNILSVLHFSDEIDSVDKLYKIQPVLDYLRERFQSVFKVFQSVVLVKIFRLTSHS